MKSLLTRDYDNPRIYDTETGKQGFPENDIYLDARGNLAMGYDQEAVAQICKNVTRTILGEMVLNIKAGIPYFEDVFIANHDTGVTQAYILKALTSVKGVLKILDFHSEINAEHAAFKYSAKIQTIYGVINLNG